MARPVRPAPSTTLLFRITIQRPRGRIPKGLRRSSRIRVRRRRYGRVRFRSRRALPPFFLFMAKHRRRIQRRHPHFTMVQTAKRLGRMWQRLPEEDKERYKIEADRMRTRRRRARSRRSRSRRMRMRRIRTPSRGRTMRNLMVSFTTRAASLKNFLMSYL